MPGERTPGNRGRLAHCVSGNRPLAWLVGLGAGLLVFLTRLPSYVRSFFWRAVQAQGVVVAMLLGFGLLALSLLWSTGQRMDTLAFLAFNVRGRRPRRLDALMWGLTQIGNGVAIVVLALVLFIAGGHPLAYEFGLGGSDVVAGGRAGESPGAPGTA